MSRPYSLDLRKRVVASVEEEGLSRRQTAARFGVAVSTVILWIRLYRETGDVSPRQIGGYKPRKIAGAHHDWLVSRCRAGDFTLQGLVRELAARGLKVDYRSVWNFVHEQGLSYKKRRWSPANVAARTSRAGGGNG